MASTSMTYHFVNGASRPSPVPNGNGAGPSNGHLSVYSSAPSSPPPGHLQPLAPYAAKPLDAPSPPAHNHNQAVVNHIYHAGFRSGNYSDITLQVPWRQYALHSLIISRSPYLAHVMSTSPSSKVIAIALDQEPHITPESFDIALSYLYSPVCLEVVHPHNARAVLAAACLLGGMDELSHYAYQLCQQSLSAESIADWLAFIETIPASEDPATPDPPTVFGPYGRKLREDVFNFLAVSLPTSLGAFAISDAGPADASGYDTLLHVYARLPFDFFKRALESTQFPLHGNHARFKFAKTAIALRKQQGMSRDAEETVVLAFDGQTDSGNAIHITRKMKKRPLWKVTK